MARRAPRHWLPARMSIRLHLHAGRAGVEREAARVRRGSGAGRELGGDAPAPAGHAESLHVITTPSVNASPASCVALQSVSALFARVTVISNCVLPGRRVRVTCRKVVQKRNNPALKYTRVCVRGVTWRLDPRVQLLRQEEEEEKPWPHPPGRSVRTTHTHPHTHSHTPPHPAGCVGGAGSPPRRPGLPPQDKRKGGSPEHPTAFPRSVLLPAGQRRARLPRREK